MVVLSVLMVRMVMLMITDLGTMTVFGTISPVPVAVIVVMFMFMVVGMAVVQFTVAVGMIVKMTVLVGMFMLVLQLKHCPGTVLLVA